MAKARTSKVGRKQSKAVTARGRGKQRANANGSSSNLVVVESPAKARTLSRILGNDYQVKASMGHVRDLPERVLGVDIEKDFSPHYEIVKAKRKVLDELRRAAREASAVYLATDPDREGEAISWHLLEAAKIRPEVARRVVFHEITADAIRRAFQEPRAIDMALVDAQQARRVLDRLVGYHLSPLLWQKVRRGLSAGRVQSTALGMVVDREREIQAFVPQEYWSIDADLALQEEPETTFSARLHGYEAKRQKLEVPNEETAHRIVADLERGAYAVGQVRKRQTSRRPAPPFITSTLQQEAWRKLRFTARRTMTVAQQLYEGLPLDGEGPVGLITYMRTDSTQVAAEAVQEMRRFIGERYGETYLPKTSRSFQRRVKGAQEAHEAIRPTVIHREPEGLRASLTRDQMALYQLVWQRAVASQMADARFDQTSVDVRVTQTPSGERYILRATGSVLTFPGFLALYREGLDDANQEDDEGRLLPDLREGQALSLLGLHPLQHFTQPPPRYNEATLVKAMEEHGIGRPSTYAPILSTLQDRGYIQKVDNRFHPLKLGTVVADLLRDRFPEIMEPGFTSRMEENLDEIARGEQAWVPVLQEFFDPFSTKLETAKREMPRVRDVDEESEEICPTCGRPMVIKTGRFGRFLSCSGFPECKTSKPLVEKTGAHCPRCGGDLLVRRSGKTRRTFYGCSNYPTCNFLTNDRPLPHPCPQCGGLVVMRGQEGARCTDAECGWSGTQAELEHEAEAVGV